MDVPTILAPFCSKVTARPPSPAPVTPTRNQFWPIALLARQVTHDHSRQAIVPGCAPPPISLRRYGMTENDGRRGNWNTAAVSAAHHSREETPLTHEARSGSLSRRHSIESPQREGRQARMKTASECWET